MPQANEPAMDLCESLELELTSAEEIDDIRNMAYNIYDAWAVDKFIDKLDRRTNFKSLGIKPVFCKTNKAAVESARELAKIYGDSSVEVFPAGTVDVNGKPFHGEIENISGGLYIFMWSRFVIIANGEFSCALSTSDSLEKIQRKLSKAGITVESVKLTENIDWEVVSGPPQRSAASADAIREYLVDDHGAAGLQFVSTSWYFLEVLRALRQVYGKDRVVHTFGKFLLDENIDESKIEGSKAVVVCSKQLEESVIAVITDDSPDKILREIVKASSKQESLTESLGYAAVPEIRHFQTICHSSRAIDIITELESQGVREFPLVVNTEAGVTAIYADAVSAYGRSDVVMVWGIATTGNDFYRKAKETKNVVLVKPTVTSWNVVMIATEDPVDKVVRKLTMARLMTEALPPSQEIDYPPIDSDLSLNTFIGELWAQGCDVKYGITGIQGAVLADAARRIYGTCAVRVVYGNLADVNDHHYSDFFAKAASKQVWMLFASFRAVTPVMVTTDDSLDKILRKVTGANSVEESKSRAILKKLTTKASDVDPEQLKIGQKVEREHTSNPKVATQIALAHLGEKPDYYTKLDKAGLIDESAIDVELISNRMAEMQIHLRANQYVKAVFRNLRDFNKSLKFAMTSSLLSSQITVARTVYGSNNVAFAYYDDTPTIDELRQMEGDEVAVLIQRASAIVPAVGRILLIATSDSFEKIARRLAAYSSTEETMQPTPGHSIITNTRRITESTHIKLSAVYRKSVRIEYGPMIEAVARLEEVTADLSFAVIDMAHDSCGIPAILNLAGYDKRSLGQANYIHQPCDEFIEDCTGRRVVGLYYGPRSSSPMSVTFVRTDDSLEKIERRMNRAVSISESNIDDINAVVSVKTGLERISVSASSVDIGYIQGSTKKAAESIRAAGYEYVERFGYDEDKLSDEFLKRCANKRVICLVCDYGSTLVKIIAAVAIITDDSIDKIKRKMVHGSTIDESSLVPDPVDSL